MVGVALAVMFVTCVSDREADLDMWHEMALIRESLRAGALLTRDVFAYTPTVAPMVNHEWGNGVILYYLATGAGAWAVVVFKLLLALGTAVLAVWCARRRGASFPVMSVLGSLALLLFRPGCSTLRAQMYTFLFLAVLLCFLELDDAGKGWWVLLWAPMFVLWVNLHGGCVVGIVLLGCYAVEQFLRRRPFVLALGGAALAVALLGANPFGMAYYGHMWRTLQMPRPAISEWDPLWQDQLYSIILFVLMMAAAVYAVVVRGVRACRGVLILAALAGGSVLHLRMTPLFAVAWMAYVPGWVEETQLGEFLRSVFRKREAVTAVAAALAAVFGFLFVSLELWRLAPSDKYPMGAVEYLAERRFTGNVMTHFNYGAYVSWRLYPAVKVSLDGRYDIAYPTAVADEQFAFHLGRPGWRETLARYPTDLVLVSRKSPIATRMPGTGWKRVYRDRKFDLYARPGIDLPSVDRSDTVFQGVFP